MLSRQILAFALTPAAAFQPASIPLDYSTPSANATRRHRFEAIIVAQPNALLIERCSPFKASNVNTCNSDQLSPYQPHDSRVPYNGYLALCQKHSAPAKASRLTTTLKVTVRRHSLHVWPQRQLPVGDASASSRPLHQNTEAY
jgi:hypothetical protein